jgi:hypothetical protein
MTMGIRRLSAGRQSTENEANYKLTAKVRALTLYSAEILSIIYSLSAHS